MIKARRTRTTAAAVTPRTRGQMSAETIEQLVRSARLRFAQSGYAATSMDALCAEAGLTRGALYHHFGGKDGLLEAVVCQIDSEITAEVEAAFGRSTDTWIGLQAGLSVYLSQALKPEIQQILIRDAPAALGHRLRALDKVSVITPLTQALAELIKIGRIHPADPEALARLLNGALDEAAVWISESASPKATLKKAQAAFTVLLGSLSAR
jgi:AcrR family transcriptional regulator